MYKSLWTLLSPQAPRFLSSPYLCSTNLMFILAELFLTTSSSICHVPSKIWGWLVVLWPLGLFNSSHKLRVWPPPPFFLIENQCSFWISTSSIRNQKSLLWFIWNYFFLYSISSFFLCFFLLSRFLLDLFFFFLMFSSVTQSCPTLCRPCRLQNAQASLSIANSQSLLKLMSVELMTHSNHLILCRPLLFLPSVFPITRVFSSEIILCIKWPKYWSFSFNISPSSEYSGLISFRIDWLDFLAVQGTLKSSPTPQFKSISSSVFNWRMVQLSHPYMTTGKTIDGPL